MKRINQDPSYTPEHKAIGETASVPIVRPELVHKMATIAALGASG